MLFSCFVRFFSRSDFLFRLCELLGLSFVLICNAFIDNFNPTSFIPVWYQFYSDMEEQCGGTLGDFVGLDFGSYMDSYALYCHLLRCAKPLCYGSAHCSNLCLCVSRLNIAVSKLLIEEPSCYFDAFGKFLIFLNQVLCLFILWCWSFLGCNHSGFIYSFNYLSSSHVRPRSLSLARLLLLRVSSVSLFWYSIIFCGGVGFVSRPCLYFDIISWSTHVTCEFIFCYFYQNPFIHRLFSASWAPSVCHLRRRGQPSWCWYSRVWYSFWICGIPQDASWQDFSPVSRIILSSHSHNGLA